MLRHLLDWTEAAAAGRTRCGGKGFNLARLARYGFPVPKGGVVGSEVFRPDLTVLPDEVRGELAAFLHEAGLADTPVAVRSSAVAEDSAHVSFAGIHDSVLNVRGLDAIERAILGCYRSVGSPRALAYRARMGIAADEVACAIVVCEMVDARCAGVAFSGDPRTGRRDLIAVEAARGLGDQVVGGTVNPESLRVRYARGVFTFDSREGAGEPVLSEEQATELARLVVRVHWALGEGQDPQDVEWAYDGDGFWLLQARPVTRFPPCTFDGVRELPIYWSNANINDAVPGVVSLYTWSLIQLVIDDVLYAALHAVGYPLPSGMQTVRRFDGHAYFDFTGMQWAFYDAFGLPPSETAKAIGGHFPEIPTPPGHPLTGVAGARRLRARLRLLRRFWGFEKEFYAFVRTYFDEVAAVVPIDLTALGRGELHELGSRLARLVEEITPLVGLANAYTGAWKDPLERSLGAVAGDRAPALMNALLTGSGDITSAEQGYRIHDLAAAKRAGDDAFARALGAFVSEFGHRAVYEADVMNPRWSEDPSYILDQVARHLELEAGESPRGRAQQVRREAEAEIERLTWLRRPVIRWLAKHMRAGLAMREAAKSAHSAILGPARLLLLDVGRRLVEEGHLGEPSDVFHLTQMDVEAYLTGRWSGRGAHDLTGDRKAQRDAWLRTSPPNVIVDGGAVAPVARMAPEASAEGALHGISVSGGRFEGTARTIRHPHDGARLGHGEILVTPSTDPGWTPLFVRAAALVMETGGYLSHGAIVAREFGIPAVVNIPGVFERVRDGDVLRVDGDHGTVTVNPGRGR